MARSVSKRNLFVAAMLVAILVGGGAWWGGVGSAGPAVPVRGEMEKYAPAETPRPVPALAFTGPGGQPLSLADFRGKVVLLNLWATWCAPCVEEMPSLDRLQQRLGGNDFQVVALSLDRGGAEQVEPFLEKLGIRHLEPYLDPQGQAMGVLSLRGLPTSLLIDREGRELGRLEGAADWNSPDAIRLIEFYLGRGGDSGVIRTSAG